MKIYKTISIICIAVLLLSKAPSLTGAQVIGENSHYVATIGAPDWNAVTITEKNSNRVIASLRGGDELDRIGRITNAILSTDDKFVAYSVGTSSSGTEIRLFELNSGGQATQLSLSSLPIDLSNATHVYQKPLRFSETKFLFDVSADRKVTHFSYDIKARKIMLVGD